MKDHVAILEDLARNPANCRVLMRAEREALEAAVAALVAQAARCPQAYDAAEAGGQQLELVCTSEVTP